MFGWKAEQTLSAGIYDDPDTRARRPRTTPDSTVFGIGLQTMLDGALVRLEYKMGEIGDLTLNDRGGSRRSEDGTNVFSLRNTELPRRCSSASSGTCIDLNQGAGKGPPYSLAARAYLGFT